MAGTMDPTTQQQPRKKAAPLPPATPEELVAARRRRHPWPFYLLGGGVVLVAVRMMTASLHPSTSAQAQVLTALQTWAVPAAICLIVVGAIVVLLRLIVEPRGASTIRVLAAAGTGLHLGPNQIRLFKADWKRGWRIRRLRAGLLRYQAGQVTEDLSEDLAEALVPFAAGPLLVKWEPDRDRFRVSPLPPVALRVEEKIGAVGTMARTLEHILGDLAVDQGATTASDSGEVTSFVARYRHTTRDMAESFRQRVKLVLDAKVPCPTGYWMVKLDPAQSQITVTPSKPMPTIADLPLLNLSAEDRMRIPIGEAAAGDIVYWEPEKFPHMLLVGPTGSGKTILINSCIELVAARGWRVDLLDPKELSFRGYIPETLTALGRPTWPGITSVATSEQESEELIHEFYEDLRERYYQLKIFGVTEAQLQPRLLIIDECGELVERLNAYHTSEAKYLALIDQAIKDGRNPDDVAKPKGARNPVLAEIWSILRLGRQALMYVISGTQRPDVNFIPGEARSNLTCRAAMGKQDGAALDMVFNTRSIQQRIHETVTDPATGEKSLQRIRGRATIDVGNGPQSVQTFWTPDPAKVITGELNAADTELVARQYAYVVQSAAQWGKPTNPERTGFDTKAPPDIVDRKKAIVSAALQTDLTKPEPAKKQGRDSGRPARDLTAGDTALLEIDGEEIPVEVTEVEDDPYYLGEDQEVHELQITYRIAAGHDRAGELGVTTLADDEKVDIET